MPLSKLMQLALVCSCLWPGCAVGVLAKRRGRTYDWPVGQFVDLARYRNFPGDDGGGSCFTDLDNDGVPDVVDWPDNTSHGPVLPYDFPCSEIFRDNPEDSYTYSLSADETRAAGVFWQASQCALLFGTNFFGVGTLSCNQSSFPTCNARANCGGMDVASVLLVACPCDPRIDAGTHGYTTGTEGYEYMYQLSNNGYSPPWDSEQAYLDCVDDVASILFEEGVLNQAQADQVVTDYSAKSPRCFVKETTECTNKRWAKCGGKNYQGATCCPEGTSCSYVSSWYSQCKPQPSATCRNLVYSQCDGKKWKGDTCCPAGSSCQYVNQWYSQCRHV